MSHRPRCLWAPRQAATSGHAQSRWRGFLLRLLSVFTDTRTYVPGPCRGFLSAPEGTERGRLPEMGHGVPGRDRRGAASDSQEDRRLWARRPTTQAREHGAAPPHRLGAPSAGGLGRRMSVATRLERAWSATFVTSEPTGRSRLESVSGVTGFRKETCERSSEGGRELDAWRSTALPLPLARGASAAPLSAARFAGRPVRPGATSVSLEAPLRSCHRLKLL